MPAIQRAKFKPKFISCINGLKYSFMIFYFCSGKCLFSDVFLPYLFSFVNNLFKLLAFPERPLSDPGHIFPDSNPGKLRIPGTCLRVDRRHLISLLTEHNACRYGHLLSAFRRSAEGNLFRSGHAVHGILVNELLSQVWIFFLILCIDRRTC